MRVETSFRSLGTCLSLVVLALGATFASAFASAQGDPQPGVQAMKLVAGQSGWLLANDRLFYTTTLGASWTEITPPNTSTLQPHGVFFSASGNGWVLQASTDQQTFSVAHTSDQGAHWTASAVPSAFNDGLVFGGAAFPYFVDDQHGWLTLSVQSSSNFRPGILFHTDDGGNTWNRLPDPPVGGDLTFTDATHGFTGPGPRGDELFSTADAGLTWQRVSLAAPANTLADVPSTITLPAFSTATRGVLLRSYEGTTARYETTNGGATWNPVSNLSAVAALAADGSTAQLARKVAMPSGAQAGALAATPGRSSFSTASQGWIIFSESTCQADSCTQSSSLQGTLDGGKTFFALGKIPGVSLETTRRSARATSTTTSGGLHPNAVTPLAAALPSSAPLINQMGFDKCEILTPAQMQDWYTNSPYRAVGAYIGGISASCTNLGFTPAWAATILAQGWGIIPIWVGPQAPNSTLAHRLSGVPATDQATGVTEADAAAARMAALGFGPGSIIYYDMEAYTRTAASEASTQAFVEGWVSELHVKGYQAAIYSSHPEIQDWTPAKVVDAPDAIWFAFFYSTGVPCGTRCQNTVSTDIPDIYWANHQRLRQTSSSFNSTYGTTTANIDEDWTDGPVVILTGNRVTVATAGSGLGSITSADGFIACGSGTAGVCSAVYATGASVTLTATPAALSTFVTWTGCTTFTATTCTVTPTAAASVTATFNITPPVFTIASSAPSLLWSIGKSVATTITISPKAPYQGVFTFACAGLPAYLHCAFSPSTVTADGSGTSLTTTLSMTASSMARNKFPVATHRASAIQMAMLLTPFLVLPLALCRRKGKIKARTLPHLMLLLLMAASTLAATQLATGCSDGGTIQPTPIYTGTMQVQVTSAGVSQMVTIPITVEAN